MTKKATRAAKPTKAKLTAKQKLFVAAYLEVLNATEAARLASYKGNDVTLAAVGYENLRKPQIKAAIDAALHERAMGFEEVLSRISDIGRGDLGEFLGLSVDELKQHPRRRLLKKVERKLQTIPVKDADPIEVETVKLELYSAENALFHLWKHHQIVSGKPTDRNELTGPGGKPLVDLADLLKGLTNEQLTALGAGLKD